MPAPDPAPDAVCVVLATAPDRETGLAIARALVERRVAACVNVVPGATSVYRWKGAVEEAAEALLVVKTARARLPDLERALLEVHPYEVPELVALDAALVAARYRAWVLDETR